MNSEKIIWLSTIKTTGRPHLIPIYFVYTNKYFFVCTPSTTQKVKNVENNKFVVLSLENGTDAFICEGIARVIIRDFPESVISSFKTKYQWNLVNTPSYNCLIEIKPINIIKFKDKVSSQM